MNDLFLKRMDIHHNSSSQKLFNNANLLMNKTFDRTSNYKKGRLYDVNGDFLEDVDFKYQYVFAYTINKDKVEFNVQFRPHYHPDVKYKDKNGLERLGFYLDVPNDNGEIEKWLMFGRNDTLTFTRYNILKCNWTIKWIVNGRIMSCLGCLRNRNNYNSGVWSDGFVTTVENQAQFLVPSNKLTKTIDYDMRFMLSDNEIHPKVYAVTKVEDTFPVGVIKVTLVQDHFNPHVDNIEEQICNYYDSALNPLPEIPKPKYHIKQTEISGKIEFNGSSPVLHIAGSARTLTAVITNPDKTENTEIEPVWSFRLNGEEKSISELTDFVIEIAADHRSLTIAALQSARVEDVLEVGISDADLSFSGKLGLEVQP